MASSSNKSKTNTVWRNALQEQTLCDDLDKINDLIRNNDEDQVKIVKIDRGIETYKYSFSNEKSSNSKQNNKNHLSENNAPKVTNTTTTTTKLDVKERVGASVDFDPLKSRLHILANEFDSETTVIKEIQKQLNESNGDIITRCVKVLGRKKALELLYATEDIEDNGGMFTSEGDRRRSPGGVYLQLIKRDDTILNCQRKEIFLEDQLIKKKKKSLKRLRQRNKFEMAKKELIERVKQDKLNANSSSNSNKNGEGNKNETGDGDEDFNDADEENMIYFDE